MCGLCQYSVPTEERVVRGGSFDIDIGRLRTGYRNTFLPNEISVDNGIRCARTLSTGGAAGSGAVADELNVEAGRPVGELARDGSEWRDSTSDTDRVRRVTYSFRCEVGAARSVRKDLPMRRLSGLGS